MIGYCEDTFIPASLQNKKHYYDLDPCGSAK